MCIEGEIATNTDPTGLWSLVVPLKPLAQGQEQARGGRPASCCAPGSPWPSRRTPWPPRCPAGPYGMWWSSRTTRWPRRRWRRSGRGSSPTHRPPGSTRHWSTARGRCATRRPARGGRRAQRGSARTAPRGIGPGARIRRRISPRISGGCGRNRHDIAFGCVRAWNCVRLSAARPGPGIWPPARWKSRWPASIRSARTWTPATICGRPCASGWARTRRTAGPRACPRGTDTAAGHAGDLVHVRLRDPQRQCAARRRHPGGLRRPGLRRGRPAAAAARAAGADRDRRARARTGGSPW